MTENASAERDDTFILEPVILMRVTEEEVQAATIGEGEEQALMVFRAAEEAARFQEASGKCTAEEGYRIVGGRVDGGAQLIANALEKTGVGYVAMPESWTGDGGVDLFTAEDFLRLLDSRTVTVTES
jgi:hypothetical protein